MTFSRKINNNSVKRTQRRRARNLRGRPQSFKQQLLSCSEMKTLTESSHHFPLTNLSALVYAEPLLATGGWTATNLIAQGTTNNTRIGMSVTLSTLDLFFNLYAPVANPDTVRIMVIYDISPQGLSPSLNDIFDNPANNLSVIAPASTRQFRLLVDRYVNVGGYNPCKQCNIDLKVKYEPRYFSGGSSIADIENGALYVLIVSVNGQASTECLQYFQRITYHDI